MSFPNADKVKHANLPKRKIAIPTEFQSHVHYKQVFKAALTGTSNTMLRKMLSPVHHVFLKLHKSRLKGKDIIGIVCWNNSLYLNLDLYTSLYAYVYTHIYTLKYIQSILKIIKTNRKISILFQRCNLAPVYQSYLTFWATGIQHLLHLEIQI